VSRVAEDPDVLVIGSQSILGSYPEDRLPPEATGSMEVDTAFLTDPGNTKSDRVDGTIGELSNFHDTHGYYPQGVSINTGVFPAGWKNRLVIYETPATEPGRGLCLEPHDCVLAKLVRFDRKEPDQPDPHDHQRTPPRRQLRSNPLGSNVSAHTDLARVPAGGQGSPRRT
jgi:hypothetical protein